MYFKEYFAKVFMSFHKVRFLSLNNVCLAFGFLFLSSVTPSFSFILLTFYGQLHLAVPRGISYSSMPDFPQQTSVSLESQFLAEGEVGFNSHSRGFSSSKTELNYV